MATQYTDKLKLALPTQGELSGTWGTVVNDNITSMIEEAIAGRSVINTWTTNAHTLTTADGTTSESRCAMLEFTDTGTALTGAGEVICPAKSKLYVAKNSAGQTITVKTSSGTGVAVPNGETMWVYCDGTNVEEAVTYITSLGSGQLDVDNIRIDGNTISATDTNGDINITPNGVGDVVLGNAGGGTASVVYFGGRNSVPYAYVGMNASSNFVEYVHGNTTANMEARVHNVMTSTNTSAGNFSGELHGYSLGTQTNAMTWSNSGVTFPNDVTFTASGVDKITYSPGTPTTLKIVDSAYQYWGTGNDIEIGHSSGVSSIMYYGSSGYLVTQGTLYIKGVNHPMSGQSEDMIKAISNAGVSLYYNNSEKLATISNGIFVHGTTIGLGGNTLNAYETDLVAEEPTQDRTITIPNQTGTLPVTKVTNFGTSVGSSTSVQTNWTFTDTTSNQKQQTVRYVIKDISFSSGPTTPTLTVGTYSGTASFSGVWYYIYNTSVYGQNGTFTSLTDLLSGVSPNHGIQEIIADFTKTNSGYAVRLTACSGGGMLELFAETNSVNIASITLSSGGSYNITIYNGSLTEVILT